jgi:hypothetical protein
VKKIKSLLIGSALTVFSISIMTGCSYNDTDGKAESIAAQGLLKATVKPYQSISFTLPNDGSSAKWYVVGAQAPIKTFDFQINSNYPLVSVENATLVSGNTYRITFNPNITGKHTTTVTAVNEMQQERKFELTYNSAITGILPVLSWYIYRLSVSWDFNNLAYCISPVDEDADSSQAAMDSSGNTIIVWVQDQKLFKSEYRNGAWGHPGSTSDFISPAGGTVSSPQVAMDDNGNAIIVWSQYNGSYYQIFKSEYRNGAWVHPATLADSFNPGGEGASIPQVAMDNNGNALIVWNQGGINGRIFKSEYRNGVWVHPSSVSDYISVPYMNAYAPQVAMDNDGNAIIVWEGEEESHTKFQVFKGEYRNGSWAFPSGAGLTNYISVPGQSAQSPQVAMDNNGNAIIVWQQKFIDGSTQERIYKSEYRNGSWNHPSGFSGRINPAESMEFAEDPGVAMDDSGNAVIVFEQSGHVFKSEYRNGSWVHPANAEDFFSPGGSNASEPFVSMDNSGNAIVTWIQSDGTNSQVFKSRYRNGAWVHPTGITDNISPDGENAVNARLTCNNGLAVIVWTEPIDYYKLIFMAELPEYR